MNANRLLSHFKKISDAPDAVERLRRFILDLAVRGKLVKPETGSATSAVPDGTRTQPMGKAVDLPLATLPFEVPAKWRWAYLTSIATVQYGYAFASSQFNAERRGMPLIRIRDIAGRDTQAYYEGEYEQCYIVNKGDYLVGMDGDFNVRQWCGPKALLNQRVLRITGWHSEADGPWCVIPLQMILDHVHGQTSQTTVKHLSAKQMNGIRIPLPPLAEQHRIVEKVDELMLLCDQLEASQKERESRRDRLVVASLNRLSQSTDPDGFKKHARFQLSNLNRLSTKPEHIKELRKAILNLAVRGKLVPQEAMIARSEGRSYESATELVERLGRHSNYRKAAHQQADKRGGSSLPDLPIGWAWTRMPEIGELNRGRSRHRPRNEKRLYGGPHPFIQTGDVRRSQGTIRHYEQTYSEMGLSQSRMWPKNTLCITIAANIAETGILTFDACFPDSVVGFRYEDPEMPVRYLEYFLRTAKERLNDFAPATAQKNINLDVLANVTIPLPPLAEQKRIVAKVDELMLICDQLENQLEYQQKGRRQLLEALLHEALEGVGEESASSQR